MPKFTNQEIIDRMDQWLVPISRSTANPMGQASPLCMPVTHLREVLEVREEV